MTDTFPGSRQTVDDGAYDHLRGSAEVPRLRLPSTVEGVTEVVASTPWTVLFLFPATGMPGEPDPVGWLDTPGAYGCTEESCGFRDVVDDFHEAHASVRGISNQTMREQTALAQRLNLPYPLMSDEAHVLVDALDLPTFTVAGCAPRIRRATLIVTADRRIRHVVYPIPDPATHARDVLSMLQAES